MFKNLESPTTTKICWLGCRRTSWQGLISSNINGLLCPLWSKRAILHCVQWKTKHRGSPLGWCFQSVLFFYTLVEGFFRSYSGHQHNAGGHRSRGFCFSFLFFLFYPLHTHPSDLHPESRRQLEIAQTCSPSQSRGLLASSAGRLPRLHR